MIIFEENKNKNQCFGNTLVMQQENETRAIAILTYPSVVKMQGLCGRFTTAQMWDGLCIPLEDGLTQPN